MLKRSEISPTLSNLVLFTGRVFLFLLLCLLFICLIFFSSRYYSRSISNLPSTVSTIVCGDSHTQTALNDQLMLNTINISTNSQPYYYTCCLLSLLLDRNPQVNTVVLGYSFHSFISTFDIMLYNDSIANANAINIGDYYSIVDYEYILKLIIGEPQETLNTITTKSIDLLFSINSIGHVQNLPFIGVYHDGYEQCLNEETVERNIQRHYYTNSSNTTTEESYQLEYLHEIANLCGQNDVDLFLVNCPVSLQYYIKVPEEVIQQYYAVALTIDATLLDYHDFPLPDSCYGNADHLNYYGATEFSLFLDSMLNE